MTDTLNTQPMSGTGFIRVSRVRPEDRTLLRDMAEDCVWVERGGLPIREPSDYCTGGEVIGRTDWVGMPEWAQGFGMNRQEIRNAVEKAIAGKHLRSRQEALIQAMLNVIAEGDAYGY